MKPVVVDQSSWGRLAVTGKDRARFLQGMLTNDVAALSPGAWCRASILNPKGRVLSVVDVLAQEDHFLVICEPGLADKTRQVLERHAIMDDVVFTPVDVPVHRVWTDPAAVWTAPPVLAAAQGASAEDVEIRRVEAGLPRYGADVSEDYFPFEANLDGAISYNKGCYVGQEVVARAHARGHANKRLVGIRLEGPGAVAPGTPVASAVRPEAGTVTSSVVSPDFGPIALGYVHKSSWDPGTELTLGTRTGRVVELPFR